MTTYTANYNFGKQEDHSDLFAMSVITANFDSLDAVLANLQTQINELSAKNSELETRVAALEEGADG